MQLSFLLLAISAITAPVLTLVEKEAAVALLERQHVEIPKLVHSIRAAKSKLFGEQFEMANKLEEQAYSSSRAAQWKLSNEEHSGEETLESIKAHVKSTNDHYKRVEQQILAMVNQKDAGEGSARLL